MTERFTETVATGIVTDNMTNKEYNCEMRIDDNFLHLINNLADENEQLKENCKNYEWYKQYKTLLNENEQLKQQMQRLYNYFADWFDGRVPPSDFSEMWDFVKEDEKWD